MCPSLPRNMKLAFCEENMSLVSTDFMKRMGRWNSISTSKYSSFISPWNEFIGAID